MSLFERLKGLLSGARHDDASLPRPVRGAGAGAASHTGMCFKERYEVAEELGRGAIGVVYVARDRDVHDRQVVIKLLHKAAAENEWLAKKFHHESEALSRIDHRGVVKVLDRGHSPDGEPFFVMELVKGRTLRSAGRDGLDLDEVANVVEQVGQALGAAHDAGVYHRDLKPENIMLQGGERPEVKLIDFGIAKIEGPISATSTLNPVAAGTLPYMSPEQLERGEGAAAADIYAMAVIAYEMITGRVPYTSNAPTSLAQMSQIVALQRAGSAVRPSALRAGVGSRVDELIQRGLAFEPVRRFRTAREFGNELALALRGGSGAGVPMAGDEVATLMEPSREPSGSRESKSSGARASSAAERLSVLRRDHGLVAIFALEGFLDAHTAPALDTAFRNAFEEGRSRVLVNCERLTYISSAGIAIFMANLPVARERGGDIKLGAVAPNVYHSIELLGLHNLFEICDTESDGLDAFGR
jgi:anti-anti-sigma factor